MARALGWFGIGLGLAEVAAPRGLARTIGIDEDRTALLRTLGMRGVATGVGILAGRQREGMWARVWGDAMDLAFLGAALRGDDGERRGRLAAATAAVAGVTLLDVLCSREVSRRDGEDGATQGVYVERSVAVFRSPEECYQFWRDFQNLARFMKHVESVEETGDQRSHWIVRGPAGVELEWDSEIVSDIPGRGLAWRSVEGGDLEHRGDVQFEPAPGGRGTIVRLELEFRPTAGTRTAANIAELLGRVPELQAQNDLRRFKQVLETGEVARTEGQPSGRRSATMRAVETWRR
jgi:uncharacterized membrane protein